MLEAGERQLEVIEPVIECFTRDGNAGPLVGEVGQTQTSGLVLLAEDHVLFGAVERPSGIDAPLQRASDVGIDVGMPFGVTRPASRSRGFQAQPSGSG